jgi:DNA-binding transcriptional LysR family regulator
MPEFLNRFPEIEVDFYLTDDFVDIISKGFDVAIRIGELQDSSLVQKKLAADRRVICASPKYIEKAGAPATLADLDFHNCLSAGAQDVWRVQGPDGQNHQVKVNGNIRSNSAEFVREAVMSGLGIGFRSIWDIGPELKSGALQVLLPEYRGSDSVAIYAVYPCRDFMPAKVNAMIDFLADLYGAEPSWEKNVDSTKWAATPKVAGRPEARPRVAAAR